MWGCCSKAITVIDCHDNDINSDTLAINTQWFLHVNDMHQVIKSDMMSSCLGCTLRSKNISRRKERSSFTAFTLLRELCCMAEFIISMLWMCVCLFPLPGVWKLMRLISTGSVGWWGVMSALFSRHFVRGSDSFLLRLQSDQETKRTKWVTVHKAGGGWEFRQVHAHTDH